MKYFARNLFVGVMIFALAGLLAVGKDKVKKTSVTFVDEVSVGGTKVKAGDYNVKFDEGTGELTILKGNKVVAKTMAHLQDATGAPGSSLHLKDNELVSVTFGRQQAVVGQSSMTTGTQQ